LEIFRFYSLRKLETPVGSVPMRHIDALIGVRLNLIDTLLTGCATRIPSSIAGELNGILEAPFNLVNNLVNVERKCGCPSPRL